VNGCLRLLDLENNDINYDGLEALAKGMNTNSTLCVLSVVMNEFETARAKARFEKLSPQYRLDKHGHVQDRHVLYESSDKVNLRKSMQGSEVAPALLF